MMVVLYPTAMVADLDPTQQPDPKPVNKALPSLIGSAVVGNTLGVNLGSCPERCDPALREFLPHRFNGISIV